MHSDCADFVDIGDAGRLYEDMLGRPVVLVVVIEDTLGRGVDIE